MIVYKVLDQQGRSQYQGFQWPLPSDGEPGEWVEVSGELTMCGQGLHGWKTLEIAQRQISQGGAVPKEGRVIWEMEIDESEKFLAPAEGLRNGDKICGKKARLVRGPVADKDGPLVFFADYIWQ